MPKKDTNAAVLGMLSSVGDRTRPAEAPGEPAPAAPALAPEPPAPAVPAPEAAVPVPRASATVSTLPGSAPAAVAAEQPAPRTLRLQPGTARALRAAWLEAKRDDVLLTAQDFASALVEEALARRRLQRAAASR